MRVVQEHIVYYNAPLKCMHIPSFTSIGWCISELYAHLYPYHNVWPEAVYCCYPSACMHEGYGTWSVSVRHH